jgi:putative spermidine/putrescine transport system substrate-binding protein
VRPFLRLIPLLVLVLVAVACGGTPVPDATTETDPPATEVTWDETVAAAQGQTVQLWMYGGEEALNRYIDQTVVPAAAAEGVTLKRVPVEDTVDAIRQIAAADRAGSSGPVDLVWVNGKNFAVAKQAGLWSAGWPRTLPNATLLDPDDATLRTDFGVPTDDQELPWSRAAFVYAYDMARLERPPHTFEELLAFARDRPGRFTYPAPPDFTGSAFVRHAVQSLGEDRAFALLAELQPLLYQGGRNQPKDQAELDGLFANGQVDLAMSYNPNFVDTAVRAGRFPPTVRPYVFDGGTLQNVSFLAMPASSANQAGAKVVADLLLSPEMQAEKLTQVGIPSVLDPDRLGTQAGLPAPSSHRLDELGPALDELPAERVGELDRRWAVEVAP